jgi:membrane-associated protein
MPAVGRPSSGGTLTVHALPAIDHDPLADAHADAAVIAAVIDIESWLSTGGLALLAAIVFAETGLLIGFFLPGDSLLFMAGFLASEAGGHVLPPLPITALVVFVAAVLGDQVGYIFGLRVGPSLFSRPGSRLFNPLNAVRAQAFFDRRGPSALVLARFIPIVRTFVPIIAGVGRMRYRTFLTYNIVGAAVWGIGVTTLGYFLGEVEIVKHNLELAAIVIVAISLIPIAVEFFRSRREHAARVEHVDTTAPEHP